MIKGVEPGIYPMLYAFFDHTGALRDEPFLQQVDVALANDAAGIAILGLGTETGKLTGDERLHILKLVSNRINGRKPLLVTVYGDTTEEQINFARTATDVGASALILQPPSHKLTETDLFDFFSHIIASLSCPTGIQNAPEFLGYGLSTQSLITLASQHDNFAIAKLECTSVVLQEVATSLQNKVMVFNGRCALELPDNLRAGASGIIPGFETIDKTCAIYNACQRGNTALAESLYKELLPTLCYVMQGIPHFITYGKLLAAVRLGIEPGGMREPALPATAFGISCVTRFARELGTLR